MTISVCTCKRKRAKPKWQAGCRGHRNQCEGVDVFPAESAGNRSQSESEHRQRQGRFSAGDDQGHFRVIQILDDAEGRQYRDAQ